LRRCKAIAFVWPIGLSIACLCAAFYLPGCVPESLPETIVLGQQETAEDPMTPMTPMSPDTSTDDPSGEPSDPTSDDPAAPSGDPPASQGASVSIDNIVVTGSLIEARTCAFGVSCTVSDPNGVVRSVSVDLSLIGGPKDTMFKVSSNLWVWSGVVTATIAGSATIYFAATSDNSVSSTPVATQTAYVQVAPTGTDNPGGPPADDPGQEGENVALGRPYTWGEPPNFRACSDIGDATQLTDGVRATAMFTTDRSWVGWQLNRSNAWTTITVDLGQVQPIKGALFSTIACVDSQEWPLVIGLLVSDDGVHYYHAGELTSLSAEHGLPAHTIDYTWSKITHSYWTQRLHTRGRFVRFAVANYPCIFVDEIEVYRGPDSAASTPPAGIPVTDMAAYIRENKLRCGIVRRIVLDAQDVKSQIGGAAPFAGQADLEAALANVIGQAMYLSGSDLHLGAEASHWPRAGDTSQFRTILPLNNLHRQVFRALAALWRAQGKQGLIGWQATLWDALSVTETPSSTPPSVSVALMQNEYRAGAFNLSNTTDSDMTVRVNVTGLPGGTNPSYVSVQPVPWTDTQRGVPVAAALPVCVADGSGFPVHIPSGMTVQIWLTFHPTGVPAGTYTGTVTADGGTGETVTVPVRLRVSPLAFPAQPTLSWGGWDNTDSNNSLGLTPQNREALVRHLREYFVDTPWGTVAAMWPKPVPTDPVQRAEYFRPFDQWVSRWQDPPGAAGLPAARNYYIHMMSVTSSFGGHAVGTAQFDAGVAQWLADWSAHWQSLGLSPNQIRLLIEDEPKTVGDCETVKGWARAIRKAFRPDEPRVLVWEDQVLLEPIDPATNQPSQAVLQLFDLCDILTPNRVTFLAWEPWRSIHRQQRDAGKPMHFYSCLGASHWLDPYSYGRLQAWSCWSEGATAMFYWSFRDNGRTTDDSEPASSWNEYHAKWSYTPLYLDATTVTSSKHMEAIREGVEDYEYLVMLKQRLAELKSAGNPPPMTAAAEALLSGAAGRVLEEPGDWFWPDAKFAWTKQADRQTADEVRIEILDMLETLRPPGSTM